MTRRVEGVPPDLAAWLSNGYDAAYRTAYLILRNAALAEEAVQDAYVRIWRARVSIPEGDGMKPWLYRVLVNACYTKLRAETRHTGRSAGPDGLPLVGDETSLTPEYAAESAELATTMAAALAGLPEHLRVPVVLRYYSGLSEAEIAAAIERPAGTVKSRLFEARKRLAENPALAELAQ